MSRYSIRAIVGGMRFSIVLGHLDSSDSAMRVFLILFSNIGQEPFIEDVVYVGEDK